MTIIIGIDPGSRRTGYGIIGYQQHRFSYMTSGHLNVTSYTALSRLRRIFLGLQQIIQDYQPEEAAIEQVFVHANPNGALKLGQARGAAMVALDIPIAEYSARQVKQSVVGYGGASKEQIQFMVARLLGVNAPLQADAADALAVAICHAHYRGHSLL